MFYCIKQLKNYQPYIYYYIAKHRNPFGCSALFKKVLLDLLLVAVSQETQQIQEKVNKVEIER